MLLLNGLTPMPWWLAGAAIGLITLVLLWTTGRRLGISGGYENLCAQVSDQPYFRRPALVGPGSWRLPFLAGLLLGGLLSALLGGGWHPTWALGLWDRSLGAGPWVKSLWMFAGGLLVGIGTRIAGGCTSGHGIFGVAHLEKASWLATLSFLASGMLTTFVVHRLIP